MKNPQKILNALGDLGFIAVDSPLVYRNEFLFQNDDGAYLLSNMGGTQWMLTTDLLFNSDLLNLKISDQISKIAFKYFCGTSGLSNGYAAGKLRLQIYKIISSDRAKIHAQALIDCINEIGEYIDRINTETQEPKYDLSMFDEIVSIDTFSPREIGERKEFFFGSWDLYEKHIRTCVDEGSISRQAGILLGKDVEVCKRFELVNKKSLSEVGDVVLKTIQWSREMTDIEDDFVN